MYVKFLLFQLLLLAAIFFVFERFLTFYVFAGFFMFWIILVKLLGEHQRISKAYAIKTKITILYQGTHPLLVTLPPNVTHSFCFLVCRMRCDLFGIQLTLVPPACFFLWLPAGSQLAVGLAWFPLKTSWLQASPVKLVGLIHPWPLAMSKPEENLATKWEANSGVRRRARELQALVKWEKPELVGVASSKAVSLNAVVVTVMAEWWVEKSPMPQAIPIDLLRREA